jgi:nucleoside-diphosphate-sugar epimerase
MKIVVTGGTGFIGSHVVERAAARGHDVIVVARRPELATRAARFARIVRGDVTNPDSLADALRRADAVVHCAVEFGPGADRETQERVTLQGTRNVLSAALWAGIRRFVHMSTLAVHRPPQARGTLREESALWPRVPRWNTYARLKLRAENEARAAGLGSSMGVVVLRPGLVFGARDRHATPRMLDALRSGRAMIVGRGDNIVPCVAAEDVADAALQAVEGAGLQGRAYELCGEERVTQRALWAAHANAAGLEPPRRRISRTALAALATWTETLSLLTRRPPLLTRFEGWVMAADARVDTTRAAADLGWRGETPIASAVARAVAVALRGRERPASALAAAVVDVPRVEDATAAATLPSVAEER